MLKASLLFVLVLLISYVAAQTAVAPAGSGTTENPYQIQTLSNLYWVSQNTASWGSNFIQTANIDASETATWFPNGSGGYLGWSPIGGSGAHFTGLYHGQSFAIKGLYINRPTQDYIGLFGHCRNTQNVDGILLIRNIILVDAQITGRDYVGSIAGKAQGWNDSYLQRRGIVYRCHSIATVTGANIVGGLIGQLYKCHLSYSYSSGSVSASSYAGGLVGDQWSHCEIRNCYSTARVENAYRMGGLVGKMVEYAYLYQCYSSGQVVGGGGLVGYVSDADFTCGATDSFWDINISGTNTSAKGTGKTTTQMKTRSTYPATWLFTGDTIEWWMVDGQTRPVLRLEYSTNIRTPHQLQMMRVDLNADYQLIWDINLAEIHNPADIWCTENGETAVGGFVPIGNLANSAPFTGTLNGNGFSVSNLHIRRSDIENQSLLGDLSGATISDFQLADAFVRGSTYTAGLASQVQNNSVVYNCSYDGIVQATWSFNGGLIAYLNSSSVVSNCFSTGTVNGQSWAGGLIGAMYNNSTVTNSYSRSSVTGSTRISGFIGGLFNSNVIHCYSSGLVSATGYPTGGFIADVLGAISVTSCFWDMWTSYQSESLGEDGVQGKTTPEMNTQSTFTEAGWDFNTVWLMRSSLNDGYPILAWDYEAPPVPLAPQNLQIAISDIDVLLTWDEVINDINGNPIVPDAYHIYYQLAGNPYGEYVYLGQSAINSFTHVSGSAMADRFFYYIKAVKD